MLSLFLKESNGQYSCLNIDKDISFYVLEGQKFYFDDCYDNYFISLIEERDVRIKFVNGDSSITLILKDMIGLLNKNKVEVIDKTALGKIFDVKSIVDLEEKVFDVIENNDESSKLNDEDLEIEVMSYDISAIQKELLKLTTLKKELDIKNSFLNTLFDTIPSPMFYKDKEGVYQQCNNAFSQNILGIKKEEIIGKTLFDLPEVINLENAKIYKEKDDELLSNQGHQFYETKVKCEDGILRDYNFYKSTCLLNGESIGIVGLMLDVSAYKKTLNELNEKNKILNDLINIDWLSNLYNRKYLSIIFEKKISSLLRKKISFSFAILDIDFFKAYNDTFGHLEGDNVIKDISNLLKNSLKRPNDYVFRLGGEEFGILFETNNSQDSYHLINKLRIDIEKLKIKAGKTQISEYVTISIGLLNILYLKKNINYSKLYVEADNLLYKAKKTGRNKVCALDFFIEGDSFLAT